MKREAMENDRDAWLGPMMRAQLTTAPDPCVDAETLAAWADGALDAKQAAAVELHASNCPRCIAALASLERTTPAAEEPEPSPSPGSLWRWLVPLTAAATAVAIWIAVPDRQVTQAPPAAVPSSQEEAAPPQTGANEPAAGLPAEPPAAVPAPEPVSPAPEPADLSKRAEAPPAAPEQAPLRADETRGRAARETFSAPAPAAPRAVTPPRSAAPQSAPAGAAADSMSERAATTLQRQAPVEAVPTSESTVLTNSLIRWRVMGWTSVERSIDGGKTWIRTAPPPGVSGNNTPAFSVSVVSVRAVDGLRATVTTSDGREFYTINGGLGWERLQGNSPAPF